MNTPIEIVHRIRAMAPRFEEHIERTHKSVVRKPSAQKAAQKAWEELLKGIDPAILEQIAKEMG